MDENPMNEINLTPRELEILKLVRDGNTNGQIGMELCITERTVRAHIQSIIQKLQVKNRLEAVMVAIKLGLVKI